MKKVPILNATLNISIFLSTTVTIHKFGLRIKVTATITPVDSESLNYVDGKVETSGSSMTITHVRKSKDKNRENYPYG